MRLRRLEPVLRRALARRLRAVAGTRRVLVAVSGGADSTALLRRRSRALAPELGLDALTPRTSHHGLRGADADADRRLRRDAVRRPRRAADRGALGHAALACGGAASPGRTGCGALRREFLARAARRVGRRGDRHRAHRRRPARDAADAARARHRARRASAACGPGAGAGSSRCSRRRARRRGRPAPRAGIDWREDASNARSRLRPQPHPRTRSSRPWSRALDPVRHGPDATVARAARAAARAALARRPSRAPRPARRRRGVSSSAGARGLLARIGRIRGAGDCA